MSLLALAHSPSVNAPSVRVQECAALLLKKVLNIESHWIQRDCGWSSHPLRVLWLHRRVEEQESRLAHNPFTAELSGLRYFILSSETILAFLPSSHSDCDLHVLIRDEGGRLDLPLCSISWTVLQIRLEHCA